MMKFGGGKKKKKVNLMEIKSKYINMIAC
jgi:hypothetical protein